MGTVEGKLASSYCLICRVDARACALPIEHVREVMRPSRVDRIEGVPPYLLGLALIRGETVPVVDAGLLLAGEASAATRWVVLRVGERRVALAVAEVLGARALDQDHLGALPPLLSGARDWVAAMGVLDGELAVVLQSGRLVEAATRQAAAATAAGAPS